MNSVAYAAQGGGGHIATEAQTAKSIERMFRSGASIEAIIEREARDRASAEIEHGRNTPFNTVYYAWQNGQITSLEFMKTMLELARPSEEDRDPSYRAMEQRNYEMLELAQAALAGGAKEAIVISPAADYNSDHSVIYRFRVTADGRIAMDCIDAPADLAKLGEFLSKVFPEHAPEAKYDSDGKLLYFQTSSTDTISEVNKDVLISALSAIGDDGLMNKYLRVGHDVKDAAKVFDDLTAQIKQQMINELKKQGLDLDSDPALLQSALTKLVNDSLQAIEEKAYGSSDRTRRQQFEQNQQLSESIGDKHADKVLIAEQLTLQQLTELASITKETADQVAQLSSNQAFNQSPIATDSSTSVGSNNSSNDTALNIATGFSNQEVSSTPISQSWPERHSAPTLSPSSSTASDASVSTASISAGEQALRKQFDFNRIANQDYLYRSVVAESLQQQIRSNQQAIRDAQAAQLRNKLSSVVNSAERRGTLATNTKAPQESWRTTLLRNQSGKIQPLTPNATEQHRAMREQIRQLREVLLSRLTRQQIQERGLLRRFSVGQYARLRHLQLEAIKKGLPLAELNPAAARQLERFNQHLKPLTPRQILAAERSIQRRLLVLQQQGQVTGMSLKVAATLIRSAQFTRLLTLMGPERTVQALQGIRLLLQDILLNQKRGGAEPLLKLSADGHRVLREMLRAKLQQIQTLLESTNKRNAAAMVLLKRDGTAFSRAELKEIYRTIRELLVVQKQILEMRRRGQNIDPLMTQRMRELLAMLLKKGVIDELMASDDDWLLSLVEVRRQRTKREMRFVTSSNRDKISKLQQKARRHGFYRTHLDTQLKKQSRSSLSKKPIVTQIQTSASVAPSTDLIAVRTMSSFGSSRKKPKLKSKMIKSKPRNLTKPRA